MKVSQILSTKTAKSAQIIPQYVEAFLGGMESSSIKQKKLYGTVTNLYLFFKVVH